MTENKQVFDDYKDLKQVDCEECEHIYTGACDGVSEGSSKSCTSFLATRRVVTLRELKALTTQITQIKYLRASCILTGIALLGHLLTHIFFG